MTAKPAFQRLMFVVRAMVTVTALWLVFYKLGIESSLLALCRADLSWLVIAGVITMAQIVLVTWRWAAIHLLLAGKRLPRSLLLGQLMRTTIGGDAVRVVAVAHKTGVKPVLRSVACDRLVGLAVLVAPVSVTSPPFAFVVSDGPALASAAAIAAVGVATFLPLFVAPLLPARWPFIGGFSEILFHDLRREATSGALSWTILLTSVSVYLVLAHTLGVGPSLPLVLAILTARLITSVPISLGGWGIREATFASAFVLPGRDPTSGTATPILFGLTTPLGGTAVEVIFLAREFFRAAEARDWRIIDWILARVNRVNRGCGGAP
jgi:hypothetical protein